jgi:hypothetical protein
MNVWHFSNGKLSNDRDDKIEPGLSLACNPDGIELCVYGFHGSKRITDALGYAPGSVLSYCEVGGEIIESDDKIVASIRRHLIVVDVERTLHLRLGVRLGLRLGLRIGLRIGLRLVLRIGLRLGVRLGLRIGLRIGLRLVLRLGLRIGLRLGVRLGRRLVLRLGLRLGRRKRKS